MLRTAPERALAIVAWVMLIGGINAVASSIANLASHRAAVVPFGLVSLSLGLGLLGRRAWAMKWSELALVLGGVFVGLVSIMLVALDTPPFTMAVFQHPVGTVSRYVAAAAAALLAVYNFWAYKTLVRDDVRALAGAPQRGAVA